MKKSKWPKAEPTPDRTEPAEQKEVDVTPNFTAFCGLLRELRECRDSKWYLKDGSGSHTFREWCMKQFGERLGAFVEENL